VDLDPEEPKGCSKKETSKNFMHGKIMTVKDGLRLLLSF
jgi:hypothetical protein